MATNQPRTRTFQATIHISSGLKELSENLMYLWLLLSRV